MVKNFKLMSSTFLMMLTLAAPQLTRAMEETNFTDIPKELKGCIVKQAAYEQCLEDNTSPSLNKTLDNLALVCKEWHTVISDEMKVDAPSWKASYGITPKNEDIYRQFLSGVLIYRPDPNSDEGMITLKISDLINPLEGTFDLSNCGDTGQYLSIATGYRKAQTPANAWKVEIWFTPWFLVDKKMPQLAPNHHIRAISGNWDVASAPIGIFWTWGGWNAANQIAYCDYFTKESMEQLSSESLFEKYNNSVATSQRPRPDARVGPTTSRIHISFVTATRGY